MKTPCAVVLAALAACGGGARRSPVEPAQALVVEPLGDAGAVRRVGEPGNAPAASHTVARIARKAIGPFAARAAGGGVVVWIDSAEEGGSEEVVKAVALDPDGAALSTPSVAARFSHEATSLVVRPRADAGWVVAYATLLDRGESLNIVPLAPDGTPLSPPVDVERTSDHIAWVDLLPTPHGTACVWAEEAASGGATIVAASFDSSGKPRGLPARVARNVEGWAAAAPSGGLGIALVAARGLSWQRLDAEGRPSGPPALIARREAVSGRVEIATSGDAAFLGWTDRAGDDPHVVLASVDLEGHVWGPQRVLDAVGGSTLVSLAADARGPIVAWEAARGRRQTLRAVHLVRVNAGGAGGVASNGPGPAESRGAIAPGGTTLLASASIPPELVVTEHGVGFLAPAPMCGLGDPPGRCAGPVVPSFVRLDAQLSVTQTEPLMVGESGTNAAVGWGLQCLGDRCAVLAAPDEVPTPVYAVDLRPRTSPFSPPVAARAPAGAPRVTGLTSITSGQPFADVAAVRVGAETFVAALAVGSSGKPPGAARPRTAATTTATDYASILLRRLDDSGQPLGAAGAVTSRARPLGGMALAPGGVPGDGAVLGWVARDDGRLQVHLAHLDAHGRRLREVQLTSARGDASDLAVAWAGDGWLVAWVDTRDGNGEVYAAKVDRDLNRVAPDERVTRASGDASDVALAIRGAVAWLAWSDPRESPAEGTADIYVARLRSRDARPMGEETRVLATAAHSRSPALAPTEEGALLGWIEDSPAGLEAPGSSTTATGAMLARLDADGRVMGEPRKLAQADGRAQALEAADGRVTLVSMQPTPGGARVVVCRSSREGMTLDAFVLSSAGVASTDPAPLLDLDASGTFEVSLAPAGDAVYFTDLGSSPGDHRVRRAAIAWGR
jgi:hypothetical protein